MEPLLAKLGEAVEFGKVDKNSPYPPNMKGQNGADELAKEALDAGIAPSNILSDALVPAMDRVGQKFSENKIFVPQMLMSAKAMGAAMGHLKPFFQSGDVKTKGTFIIGTVKGDLHDIGKNLVAMMVEGGGWSIVDLGVDV
ncbi:MAG: B12-binding domain-containing protein, partial [Bacteroidales bacterium]|nr:B12-binding domain-containing protein [Bacteroidales bacterium]